MYPYARVYLYIYTYTYIFIYSNSRSRDATWCAPVNETSENRKFDIIDNISTGIANGTVVNIQQYERAVVRAKENGKSETLENARSYMYIYQIARQARAHRKGYFDIHCRKKTANFRCNEKSLFSPLPYEPCRLQTFPTNTSVPFDFTTIRITITAYQYYYILSSTFRLNFSVLPKIL